MEHRISLHKGISPAGDKVVTVHPYRNRGAINQIFLKQYSSRYGGATIGGSIVPPSMKITNKKMLMVDVVGYPAIRGLQKLGKFQLSEISIPTL